MPILRLHAENIGPFDKLDLDLTDGKGKAHLGPHILAGVNGSGKTTVLRTIAATVARDDGSDGFDRLGWQAFQAGRKYKAEAVFDSGSNSIGSPGKHGPGVTSVHGRGVQCQEAVAAYSPSPGLRRLDAPPPRQALAAGIDRLGFETTVFNESVQSFWVDVFSREALAKSKGGANGRSSKTGVAALRKALHAVLGTDCEPDVNIERYPTQPVLRFRGNELNFSQLPAGFNATLGWVVDFLLCLESFSSRGVPIHSMLLIDEIETHLHPQWQRRILNGIRAAFPNTQIIVTTHSPFIISSCPEARVHVFDLDSKGRARLVESIDAPVGASLSANIKDVFGIRSEFGPEIEGDLSAWNELKKKQTAKRLSRGESEKLRKLTRNLASRGEELASIVADPPVLPKDVIEQLVEAASKHR